VKVSTPWRLIFLLGLVSLFADVTYEGARSVIPVYFTFILGATVFLLGVVVSFGDFLGYGLRLVTGPLADLWRKYWAMTFIGYLVNLMAVPLLALAGNWQSAALLIVLERVGKAIRTPARDVIISNVSKGVGRGKAFGIHEVMDQVGAVAGPSLAMAILYFREADYRFTFLVFSIPAFMALLALVVAYFFYRSHEAELTPERPEIEGTLQRKYWTYLLVIFISTAGFMQMQFLLYRAKEHAVMAEWMVPSLMLMAMAVDALFAIVAGFAYDRFGLKVIYTVFPATAIAVLPAMFPSSALFFLSAVMIGVVLGLQETVERAAVADLAPVKVRGKAYGIFNGAYGFSLLVGGATIGYLYTLGFETIVAYAILTQIVASIIAIKYIK